MQISTLLVFTCSAAAFSAACSSSSSTGGDTTDASTSTFGDSGGVDSGTVDSGSHPTDGAATGDTSTGGDSSTSSGDDGGEPDVFAPVEDGGEFVQFITSDETTAFDMSQEEHTTGTIAYGQPNAGASDDNVATLVRNGGEAKIGTDGAEEIVSTRAFSYGTFRFRVSLASCATSEEAVNGLFSYFNDGTLAPDGLVINREVDIEVLCGEPWFINLTIWTEYTDDTHLKNQSRVVDMRTGTVDVYANDTEGTETGTESHPELASPGWPAANTFYEMGWTWAADHLEYFIVLNGQQLTLWNATDTTRIPQLPMNQHFNIWAPGIHWSTGDNAGPPANAATLTLDWFRYDPQ